MDADAEMWGLEGYRGCDAELYTHTLYHSASTVSSVRTTMKRPAPVFIRINIPRQQ